MRLFQTLCLNITGLLCKTNTEALYKPVTDREISPGSGDSLSVPSNLKMFPAERVKKCDSSRGAYVPFLTV